MSFEAMAWAWRQKGLTATAKITLLGLANYADHDNHTAFPRVRRLAEECGLSERATTYALKRLVESGLISRHQRHREDGSLMSSEYRLNLETGQSVTQVGQQVRQVTDPGAPGVGQQVRQVTDPGADQEPGTEPVTNEPVKEPVIKSVRLIRTPTLTTGETERLHSRYDSELTADVVTEHIADALAHNAALKWMDTYRYVNKWLRGEVKNGQVAVPRRVGGPATPNTRTAQDGERDYQGGRYGHIVKM